MSDTESLLHSEADEFHLACALLSPSGQPYLTSVLEQVAPEAFSDTHYGRMWEIARKIHATGERITKRALLAEADNPAIRARLGRISGEPVYPGKITASVRMVNEFARRRQFTRLLDGLRETAVTAEDVGQALSLAQDMLGRLEDGGLPTEAQRFSELADKFEQWQAGQLNTGEVIPTPWPGLDDLLSGGFHPGRSFIVAGRLGEGKSIAGLNSAQYAAEQGFQTLVVSQEMSGLELTGRMMAAGAQVEYGEISRLSMSATTAVEVKSYAARHRDMPLWVLDRPNMTIEQVAAAARQMKRRGGLDLLVIDYLQLLKATDSRQFREQQVAHISASIKHLARQLDCAVITLAQLNRENVKSNRRPTAADLRESDKIGQDADAVILLYHQLTDEGNPTGMVTLIIDKNRFDRKADVELRWRGHQARIGEAWAA